MENEGIGAVFAKYSSENTKKCLFVVAILRVLCYHIQRPIYAIEHSHIVWCSDCTIFNITTNVHIFVVASIGNVTNECWVAMEVEYDWFVFGEYLVIFFVCHAVWVTVS